MKTWLTPTSNDDTGDNRDESAIGYPGLSLEGHDISKHGGEERSGGADGLIERDGKIPKRDVAADDGGAEDNSEGGNP